MFKGTEGPLVSPQSLQYALKIFNYFFTCVFILEAIVKIVALGVRRYFKDRYTARNSARNLLPSETTSFLFLFLTVRKCCCHKKATKGHQSKKIAI